VKITLSVEQEKYSLELKRGHSCWHEVMRDRCSGWGTSQPSRSTPPPIQPPEAGPTPRRCLKDSPEHTMRMVPPAARDKSRDRDRDRDRDRAERIARRWSHSNVPPQIRKGESMQLPSEPFPSGLFLRSDPPTPASLGPAEGWVFILGFFSR